MEEGGVVGVNILDLIDGAIEAHEVSSDAMRWTAEPVESPPGLATGGIIPAGHYYVVDETHLWGPDMVRRVEELGLALGFQMTEWQREVLRVPHPRMRSFRRRFLDNEVPAGLSRESNPASTERTTP